MKSYKLITLKPKWFLLFVESVLALRLNIILTGQFISNNLKCAVLLRVTSNCLY